MVVVNSSSVKVEVVDGDGVVVQWGGSNSLASTTAIGTCKTLNANPITFKPKVHKVSTIVAPSNAIKIDAV